MKQDGYVVVRRNMRRGVNPKTEDYASGEMQDPKVKITFTFQQFMDSTDPLAQKIHQGVRFTFKSKSYYLRKTVDREEETHNPYLFKNMRKALDGGSFDVEWENEEAKKMWNDLKNNGFEEYTPELA